MSLTVNALQDEVMSFLRARGDVCAALLAEGSLSHLLPAFDAVWRQAVHETDAHTSDELQAICTRAADAVIALANTGVQPLDVRRYALAHVLFMTTRRDGALMM